MMQAIDHSFIVLPSQKHLRSGSSFHGELGAHGDGIPQTHRAFRTGDAHTEVSLLAEDLRALTGLVPELEEDRSCGADQAVLAGGAGKFDQAATQFETPVQVPSNEPMMGQRLRNSMDGWPGNLGQLHQL